MDVRTIQNYHRLAGQGYLTRLSCPNHSEHDLVPVPDGFGIILVCPQGDVHRELGLVEYRNLEAKTNVAEMLFRAKE